MVRITSQIIPLLLILILCLLLSGSLIPQVFIAVLFPKIDNIGGTYLCGKKNDGLGVLSATGNISLNSGARLGVEMLICKS